jgi:Metallo-beta-lactamase superfamily
MQPAQEYQIVRPGLAFWQAYDPAVKTDLCCCAFETPGGIVFCDPVPLAPDALDELLAGRAPVAILLTNANHERNAVPLATRFGIDIWAHSTARGQVPATRWFEEGETLFGAETISLDGFATGETAFHLNDLLILGDALINVAPYGFSVLPDKYCEDPKRARESLKKLLHFHAEVLTFAHGLPIVSQGSERLAGLLE